MRGREIPTKGKHGVATFDILIDGSVVNPEYEVVSITITKEVNKIPMAKIVFKDGGAPEETFKISEDEEFLPGKSISIKLGHDSKNEELFKGIIVKHGIKVREGGETQLVLDCRDEAIKMTLGRHNYYYEELKDSEIIEEIIGRYSGLDKDVEATKVKHLEMVQHHITDWDFMMLRAEANGKLVTVDDGKIIIKKPKTSGKEALSVLFGSTIISFEAEMDGRSQWASVEAKSWDYANQDLFENSVDSVSIKELGNVEGSDLASDISPEQFELRHSGQVIEEELQEWTKGTLQKSRLSKIRGRAKFTGFGKIKPGEMIQLQGLGSRFNGKAFVSGVYQELKSGIWITQAQFGLDPTPFSELHKDVIAPPAAGLISPIHGLQIGKVVQLQEDPEGENRILVRLPIIDNSANGVWARVATLDAGENRGSFFLPEIDDEVIVGFLNDDPREAIVLGMVNSSAKPAPIEAQDDNHEKAIVTRSGMRVHFHDETKTITIDTPEGNKVVLDEDTTSITVQDQNDNSIVLNDAGIVMKSPFDIAIEADGKIDVKAGADITIGGVNIKASADSAMEIKGATTKLTADGVNEIKGSVVNIN